MTDIRIPSISSRYNLPAHPEVNKKASKAFHDQVDYFAIQGAKLGDAVASVPKFVAKVTIGEKAATSATPSITWNEGAVGNTLISIQSVLAEAGALIGAIAGVLTAGGKAAVGASTTGTVASHAAAGKKVASFAAAVAISPASAALNWTRLAVGEAIKILPAVGTVVGGAAGTAIGSVTSILAGVGALLNAVSGTTGTTVSATTPATGTSGV